MSKLLLIIINLVIAIKVFGQTKDFRIGIEGASASYTRDNNNNIISTKFKPGTNYYSSLLGVLEEDGVDLIRYYQPDFWMNEVDYENILKLTAKFGMQAIVDDEGYFKPNLIGNEGVNQYSRNDGSSYVKYNFNFIFNNIYNEPVIKDVVWAHMVAGESFHAHFHPLQNTYFPSDSKIGWRSINVPPKNISDAIGYFKQLMINKNIANNQYIMHVQAVHNGVLGDYYHKPTDLYKISDYFKMLNKGDLFLEGSYFHNAWNRWKDQDIPFTEDYLGKFKSIDFAHKYYNSVLVEIDLEMMPESNINKKWNKSEDEMYHSNPNIPNANLLWFQTYNSIIHGARGVVFWGLTSSYSNSSNDLLNKFSLHHSNSYFDNNNNRLVNFPEHYQKFVRHLTRELAYLKEQGYLDENSLIISKRDKEDKFGVLPPSITYLPLHVFGNDAKSITTFHNLPSSTSFFNYHRTEDFGLRYSVHTNNKGEAIMIISNPNPYSLYNVELTFSGNANPYIRNTKSLSILFSSDDISQVNSNSYKTIRNPVNGTGSNFTLSEESNPIPISLNGKVRLSFGPLDVHIIKLNTHPIDDYNNNWTEIGTNHGDNSFLWWGIKNTDKFIPGDYDRDGEEELLCIQKNSQNAWAAMTGFNLSNGKWDDWLWCNNDHEGLGNIKWWSIKDYDAYLSGDFDGDNRDELLCIQQTSNNAWASMLGFNSLTKKWDDWLWCNNDHEGKGFIKWWGIKDYDIYLSGDYDGDGKDELLCIQKTSNNAWAALVGFNPLSKKWDEWLWCNNDREGKGKIKWWSIKDYDSYLTGDFDGDGKDELLCIQQTSSNAWAAIIGFNPSTGKWDEWLWCNNDHEGLGVLGNWGIQKHDKFVVGNFDKNSIGDELLCIQTYDGASYTQMYKFNSNNKWAQIWGNNHVDEKSIDSWPLSVTGYPVTNYYPIEVDKKNGAQLLATRKFNFEKHLVNIYDFEFNYGAENISLKDMSLLTKDFMNIYPNPTKDILNIEANFEIISIEIYSVTGAKIKSIMSGFNVIDLSNLNKGLYLLKMTSKNDKVYTQKIILE